MRSLLFAVVLFAASSPGFAQEPIKLFNGKDLSGWTFFLSDEKAKMEDVWSVKDGILHCKGNPAGYIRTEKPYTSYRLKVEWRFGGEPGNSGVLMRVQQPDKVWPKSIEAQLQHQNAGDFWNIDEFKMKVDEKRTHGRNTKKMHPSNEKPVGEWNLYEITVDGPKIELKVNGLVQNTATECEVIPGFIALQSEGAPIEFRTVELTPIEPAADAAPKRLAGLEGWHVTGVGNWTYRDGVIEGQQSKDVKTYTHVVSDNSYRDFKASLKFKAVKGNSGFYFRVKMDEQGNAAGFQAEIDETRDAGGIYESKGRGWIAQPDAASVAQYFKPQEWNEMTIVARGPKVVVTVNGALASQINEPDVAMEGPFALQIHGGQDVHVMFKDIVIQPIGD